MNTYIVEEQRFINDGQGLESTYKTTVEAESYERAVLLGAFKSKPWITDTDEIQVTSIGLWNYLVIDDGFKRVWRVEKI